LFEGKNDSTRLEFPPYGVEDARIYGEALVSKGLAPFVAR